MVRVTEAQVDAAMVAVWDADSAWANDLGSSDAKAAYKAAKAAYKALADRCDREGWPLTKCGRCGGAGGWEGWPGFTCYDCGGSTKMPMKRVRFQASPPTRAKREAEWAAKAQAARVEEDARWAAFATEHPTEAAFLATQVMPEDEEADFDRFMVSMHEKARKWGSLSEKQLACVTREMAKRVEAENAVEFPRGTQTVEGEVVSLPQTRSYSGGTKTNMLVKLDGEFVGNKVMGTVPEKVWRAMDDPADDGRRHGSLVGSRVRFTAVFKLSDTDEHFGFYRSPKQVQVTYVEWGDGDEG